MFQERTESAVADIHRILLDLTASFGAAAAGTQLPPATARGLLFGGSRVFQGAAAQQRGGSPILRPARSSVVRRLRGLGGSSRVLDSCTPGPPGPVGLRRGNEEGDRNPLAAAGSTVAKPCSQAAVVASPRTQEPGLDLFSGFKFSGSVAGTAQPHNCQFSNG